MAVVPGMLLDHVGVDPARRQRAPAPPVNSSSKGPRAPRPPPPAPGRIPRRRGAKSASARAESACSKVASSWSYGPGGASPRKRNTEPGPFHVGHVPHDVEQRQVRGRHRCQRELLARQPGALPQQRGAVPVQEAIQNASFRPVNGSSIRATSGAVQLTTSCSQTQAVARLPVRDQ